MPLIKNLLYKKFVKSGRTMGPGLSESDIKLPLAFSSIFLSSSYCLINSYISFICCLSYS